MNDQPPTQSDLFQPVPIPKYLESLPRFVPRVQLLIEEQIDAEFGMQVRSAYDDFVHSGSPPDEAEKLLFKAQLSTLISCRAEAKRITELLIVELGIHG